MTNEHSPPRRSRISLGIRGEDVEVGSHLAYFWETHEEFAEAVEFLAAGLRAGDHVVVFGHEEANEKVCGILSSKGWDCERLAAKGRLSIVGGRLFGDEMLSEIAATFEAALARGASIVRLLGNIGWGKEGWPDERDIFAFEARVTEAAGQAPCVVLCLYDVNQLSGRIVLHGAFECHPLTICGNILRENPHYVGVDDFLERHS